MSQQWYIRRQGQVYGPYTSSTLNVDSVLPTDELGQSQQGPWKPAASFASFSRAKDRIAEAPINLSEEHGSEFSYDEFIDDTSVGNLQEEAPESPRTVYIEKKVEVVMGSPHVTIEHTSKRFKVLYLLFGSLFLFGLAAAISIGIAENSDLGVDSANASVLRVLGSAVGFIGFIGLVVTKSLVWWNHG